MLSSKTIRKTQSTCIDSDQSSIKAPSQGCTWRSERKNFWLQIQSKEIKKNATCTLTRNTSIYVSKNTPPEANIHKKTIWLIKNATCWENIWGKLMFTLSGIWLSKITLFWTLEFPFESFKIDSLYRKWKERGDSIFCRIYLLKRQGTRALCILHTRMFKWNVRFKEAMKSPSLIA